MIGEDDHDIGFDKIRHQRAEGIVVAELDFVGDYGVIFIDDGNDVELEQRSQRRARVEIAFAFG